MAFQQTTASDLRDLLAVVTSFAVTQGWTKVYDDITVDGQVGLSKGNCQIALGEPRNFNDTSSFTPRNLTDAYSGGTYEEHFFNMTLATSLDAGNTKVWGHTGSIFTSWGDYEFNDPQSITINDCKGPFSSVWLFSNSSGDYVHVVVQSTADQYTHFSFGILDKKGLSHSDVAYAVGEYWKLHSSNYTDPSSSGFARNDPGSTGHALGYYEYSNLMLRVPAGVLNASYGLNAADHVTYYTYGQMHRGNKKTDHNSSNSDGRILDYFLAVNNQLTTGGVPLSAIPIMVGANTATSGPATFVGELPDIRHVNISNLNPAQEIKYGSETWVVFPTKRKTTRDEVYNGNNPQPGASSIDYGLAYKKEV